MLPVINKPRLPVIGLSLSGKALPESYYTFPLMPEEIKSELENILRVFLDANVKGAFLMTEETPKLFVDSMEMVWNIIVKSEAATCKALSPEVDKGAQRG